VPADRRGARARPRRRPAGRAGRGPHALDRAAVRVQLAVDRDGWEGAGDRRRRHQDVDDAGRRVRPRRGFDAEVEELEAREVQIGRADRDDAVRRVRRPQLVDQIVVDRLGHGLPDAAVVHDRRARREEGPDAAGRIQSGSVAR
jgi:hypothetical protein